MPKQDIKINTPQATSEEEVSSIKQIALQEAVASGLVSEEHPLAAFIDTQVIVKTVADLRSAFPAHFRHTFAAKANTMRRVLQLLEEQGMGCEVASPGELEQALRAGYEPANIVFDEPAKTRSILKSVLARGVALNVDNFQELQIVCDLMQDSGSDSVVGARINPQVGAGSITAMSTATMTSKFGIPLEDEGNRERLIQAYQANPWMTAIHTHVGSQGCALELMLEGIDKTMALAETINAAIGRQQISIIDIGGGLPVNFDSEAVTPTFKEYADALAEHVPVLFSGRYTVKTEFGRSILAKSGFIAARVEYTKTSGGRVIAITHAGAQIAARTVFMPELWPIRLSAFSGDGTLKQGESIVQDVGGPCCFAGDLIGHCRNLPALQRGDYVMLHDTGAYYFSNPFFYNAWPAPAVYGFSTNGGESPAFELWRAEQSLDDMLAVIG